MTLCRVLTCLHQHEEMYYQKPWDLFLFILLLSFYYYYCYYWCLFILSGLLDIFYLSVWL